MPFFSHSKIGSFEACKLQFKFKYIDKIKVEVEDTIETFLGSRVHEAFEKLYRDLKFERRLTVEELLEAYNSKWNSLLNETVKIVRSDYTAENYRKMGERYIRDYYNRYKPFDRGRIIGLETQDKLTLDEEGLYIYDIRIDRLMDMGEGLYEVHDYKTNNRLPLQKDLDADRQLAMYSLWVKNQFKDFKRARLVWHFVAFDKEMESFRSDRQLDELRLQVLETIHRIESTSDFSPHVTSLCQWCLYMDICPMWKHEKSLSEKTLNEYANDPGVQLVDEYIRVKKELEAHKKAAEETLEKIREALIHLSEKENLQVIHGSDNILTVKSSEHIKFPSKKSLEREELVEVLKRSGRLEDVSALDIYALGQVLKERSWDDETLEKLEPFISREKSYAFYVSKK